MLQQTWIELNHIKRVFSLTNLWWPVRETAMLMHFRKSSQIPIPIVVRPDSNNVRVYLHWTYRLGTAFHITGTSIVFVGGLFRLTTKGTSKLRIAGPVWPLIGAAQKFCDGESFFMSWRPGAQTVYIPEAHIGCSGCVLTRGTYRVQWLCTYQRHI